jgi:hypothetical protein
MTRVLQLENLETGTVENCFDDSALKSNDNFEFMEVGKEYGCKIELFGGFIETKTDSSVEIKVINPEVTVGKKMMLEVQADKDIYFIPRAKADIINMKGRLFFDFTRKDLIQVDDVIHSDLL